MESLVNPGFWAGKKVFLTGHTGFKGSWLSLWLQEMGAEVVGYALPPPTRPSLFEIARVAEGLISIEGDVRDQTRLQEAIQAHRPDLVFHMAAQPLVRYSYRNPVETYATNLMGTVHLMEAARQAKTARVVVNITTDKCYENREWVWGYRENEPMGGYDPYSNSKGCAELATAAYRNSFFNPDRYAEHGVALASVRAGNVIGGGDWALDRLIPDIMRAVMAGEPVSIRSPGAIRPWQHVLEPLGGYLRLAEKLWEDGPRYADAWNFGPEPSDAKPVRWIVERIVERWPDARWVLDTQCHPHEAHYLKLDCAKAAALLDWHPRWKLDTALEKIVDWYARYASGKENMRAFTVKQIAEYCGV